MTRWLVTAAIALATLAPVRGQDLAVPITEFTLPNGLTVILHEDHSVPVASVNVCRSYRRPRSNVRC